MSPALEQQQTARYSVLGAPGTSSAVQWPEKKKAVDTQKKQQEKPAMAATDRVSSQRT